MTLADKDDALYIDLFSVSKQFNADPHSLFAPDLLHPSSRGYGIWFDEMQKAIQVRWPGLLHE